MQLSNITPEEQSETVSASSTIMLEYMGEAKLFQKKIDEGLRYLKWMLSFLLIVLVTYIASEIYRTLNPPSTEIDMRWIVQQQRSIAEQQESLAIQKKQITVDMAKNTSDALINLAAQEALAVDRADIAVARMGIEEINNKMDSLFNQQKKTMNVKTVNTDNVNTKKVIIKKK